MINVNKEFIACVKKELVAIIKRFISTIEEAKATQIADEIINLIDWDNSALMHKGLSWMTKNYLIQKNML